MGINNPNRKKKKTPAPRGVGVFIIELYKDYYINLKEYYIRLYKNYKRLLIECSQYGVTHYTQRYYIIIKEKRTQM